MNFARWALGALLFVSLPAHADVPVPQPGQSAQEQSEKNRSKDEQRPDEAEGRREPTWQQPPVYETTVEGKPVAKEDQLIGSYKQPRWTGRRRFPTTRVYVRPAGVAQFEYWFDLRRPFSYTDKVKPADFDPRIRTQYEFEFGIGHRLQVDFYLRTQQSLDTGNGQRGPSEVNEEKAELRWALANWGVIWGNPTLYFEYAHGDGNEALETKILLGGDYSELTHWGLNVGLEHAFSPSEAYHNEWLLTYGIARGIVDSEFSLGAEVQLELDEAGHGPTDYDLLAGPSIQWHPIPEFHLDLVALVGAHMLKVGDSFETVPQIHPLVVAGWEF
jgi:hypothetical protein